MTDIKAGIVSKLKYVQSGSKAFSSYIEYIDRDTATWHDNFKEFNLFTDYMDDDEKSNGLFRSSGYGSEPYFISAEGKDFIKEKFKCAQEKGSPLWQHIFSFDMQWLEEKGLYDSKTGWLDERSIMTYSQDALYKMFDKENFGSALSVSSIHFNTDHIHVHSAFVDNNVQTVPGRGRCYKTKEGKREIRCKFKLGSIEAGKREFVNQAIDMSSINKSYSNIARMQILSNVREQINLENDNILKDDFAKLISSLPEDLRLWKYGNNAMKKYRDEIDALSDKILFTYYKDEMKELNKILDTVSSEYQKAYGGDDQHYKENKMQDLHSRLGNAILTQGRELVQEKYKKTLKGSKKDLSNKAYIKSLKGSQAGRYAMDRAVYLMKQAFRKDIESLKNQSIYERLQRENDNDYFDR